MKFGQGERVRVRDLIKSLRERKKGKFLARIMPVSRQFNLRARVFLRVKLSCPGKD